jgi:hypothetical protein
MCRELVASPVTMSVVVTRRYEAALEEIVSNPD